jgi:hypothetical protein
MHGGWQLFSPTLLVEMEGSLLIRWVALYALASVWKRGERGKHTRALARSPRLIGPGPKPHRPASSFCRLFCYESVPNMF